MQYAYHPLRKRQTDESPAVPSASGVVGGTTAASVGLTSSLLLGPSASSVPSVTYSFEPNEPAVTLTSSSQTSPTSSSSPASHTKPPISTGGVLGIAAGVFVVAVAAMFAVYMYFKRRTDARARRPLARGGPSSRVEEGNRGRGGDKWKRLEGDKPPAGEDSPPAPPKTPESGKFELFTKDPSVRSVSDEKASHTFDPAAMPNFVKYPPNLAEELSTAPPSRPFATAAPESSQVVSWGGDTAADSFLSFRTSGSMSPSAVITRQTPVTTDSALHRWESAEVLIMDEAVTERPSVYSEITQNPFGDDASRASLDGNEAETRARTGNPFFNASQHNPFSDRSTQSRSRKSSVSTVKRNRSRSNSVASRGTTRAGDNALLSLIAALDSNPIAPEDESIRASMQTTSSSVYTASIAPPTPKAF
ncbi:hypothetical protein EI94DRAFT_1784370 [Lactarius quietus]|nr:hypothetical protein EI94DRAFT_1784370 [Lactarius quietus]